MNKGAEFSECGNYRYVLWRQWNEAAPYIMCIGLNPSTANADEDDPTIRNLIELMKNNGYGGLRMTNLFALISPHPEDLRTSPDPLKENDAWLLVNSMMCSDICFCWGNFKQAIYRAKKLKDILYIHPLRQIKCFGKNSNGSPKHPLYLNRSTRLVNFFD